MIGTPPQRAIDQAVARLAKLSNSEIEAFLTPDITFVPCPKSAPFPPNLRPILWVPQRICEALCAQGYGAKIFPCLARVEAVPKSAFASPGDRPSALRHFETMEVDSSLDDALKITVVDDVVTKGATLLAAASRLAKAFPRAQIRTFALVRTMGFVPDIERIVDPVVGRIRQSPRGESIREP